MPQAIVQTSEDLDEMLVKMLILSGHKVRRLVVIVYVFLYDLTIFFIIMKPSRRVYTLSVSKHVRLAHNFTSTYLLSIYELK